MDNYKLQEIIQSYGKLLLTKPTRLLFTVPSALPESILPYPKQVIRKALAQVLLAWELDTDMRDKLESGYLLLDDFIGDADFTALLEFENDVLAVVDSRDDEILKKTIRDNPEILKRAKTIQKKKEINREEKNEDISALRRMVGINKQ